MKKIEKLDRKLKESGYTNHKAERIYGYPKPYGITQYGIMMYFGSLKYIEDIVLKMCGE